MDFTPFPKLARLSREVVITEKLDGTNAQIFITPGYAGDPDALCSWFDADTATDMVMYAGSRTRWITPGNDNYGFAAWALANNECLRELGAGHHFGEWWGAGIQRRYGLDEKRFSLFNSARWSDERPECCGVVPVLYVGIFTTDAVARTIDDLTSAGSVAAPGFMDPEGVVVYHTAAGTSFKKTCKKDESPKGKQQ
jgi:hypothetical protein